MSNALKTTLLLGLLTGLLMWVGQLVGGMQGLVLGLVLAAVMNLGSYWFSDRIVLAAYGARELSEQDPAVRAGRFSVKVIPWIVPGGAVSFSRTRFPRSTAEAAGD